MYINVNVVIIHPIGLYEFHIKNMKVLSNILTSVDLFNIIVAQAYQ